MMRSFFDDTQRLHAPAFEIVGGQMVPPYESRDRVDRLRDPLAAAGMCRFEPPADFGLGPILATHSPCFVEFLQRAYADWIAAGFQGDVVATSLPLANATPRKPRSIEGQAGYFAASCESAIAQGTWRAAYASAQCAIAAAQAVLEGDRAAFALCRPPGHHAMKARFGGYCYLNNAAIAAQHLRQNGAHRVAILDIDFHHGNGTQDIFYDRNDVLFLSLHGDPDLTYPFFNGYANETGQGPGEGFTRNYPLGPGTDFPTWLATLQQAIHRLHGFAPQAVVLSLGLDIYAHDPQSIFGIATDDFATIGHHIRGLNLPTVLVMEGGYAVQDLPRNISSFFRGLSTG